MNESDYTRWRYERDAAQREYDQACSRLRQAKTEVARLESEALNLNAKLIGVLLREPKASDGE